MTSTHDSQTSGRQFGYIRYSSKKQDEDSQLIALLDPKKGGLRMSDLYIDHAVSGSKTSRPEFDRMLRDLEPGDTVTVFKLDRLGRSSGHVITVIDQLVKEGKNVRTLDGIDTTTSTGRAMLKMLAIFAEMEREFIIERTNAGLASAKAQGRTGGRPPKLDAEEIRHAQELLDKGATMAEIAKRKKVSVATLYRVLGK